MKKISIIVPVYNSEKTLDVCIKSIQKQICEDYEVIFVDDQEKPAFKKGGFFIVPYFLP